MLPLVLQRIAPEQYEIVSGELEYYASLKAQKIDPSLGKVNAFVISPEQKEEALKQLNLLKKEYNSSSEHNVQSNDSFENVKLSNQLQQNHNELISWIKQLQKNHQTEIRELRTKLDEINSKLSSPSSQLSQTVDDETILKAFNEWEEPQLKGKLQSLKISTLSRTKLDNIMPLIIQERNKEKFAYLDDLERVDGIAEKTINNIRQKWK